MCIYIYICVCVCVCVCVSRKNQMRSSMGITNRKMLEKNHSGKIKETARMPSCRNF